MRSSHTVQRPDRHLFLLSEISPLLSSNEQTRAEYLKETIWECVISGWHQLTPGQQPYFFRSSSTDVKMCAYRWTEDCEQRVKAMVSLDVCSRSFSSSRSEEAVRSQRSRMLCDVLLDQAIMPGVGNIIKNEALFDSGLHPAVKVQGWGGTDGSYTAEE